MRLILRDGEQAPLHGNWRSDYDLLVLDLNLPKWMDIESALHPS